MPADFCLLLFRNSEVMAKTKKKNTVLHFTPELASKLRGSSLDNPHNTRIIEEHMNPKPKSLSAAIQIILAEVTKGKKDPALVTIIRKQIQRAEAGDTKAAAFVLDRAYGMPKQTVETVGDQVTKLTIEIVRPKR